MVERMVAPSPSPEMAREARECAGKIHDECTPANVIGGVLDEDGATALILAFGQRQYERGREEASADIDELVAALREWERLASITLDPGLRKTMKRHAMLLTRNVLHRLRGRAAFDPKGVGHAD